jgi:hypothetical protein
MFDRKNQCRLIARKMALVTVDEHKVNIFPYIGIIPLLVGLGYLSCIFLFGGIILIILSNDGFFDPNAVKILYLSDGMSKHLALVVLGFGSCYSILFSAIMIVSWHLKNVSMFGLAVINVISFHGVLSYPELNGSEHPCFVAGLALSHAGIHHIASNSKHSFPLYKYATNTSTGILVLYVIFWFLADIVFKMPELKITTVALELVVWCIGCFELTCLVSFMHERESHRHKNLFPDVNKEQTEAMLEARNAKDSTESPPGDAKFSYSDLEHMFEKKPLNPQSSIADMFERISIKKPNERNRLYEKTENPRAYLFPSDILASFRGF